MSLCNTIKKRMANKRMPDPQQTLQKAHNQQRKEKKRLRW
jgi:hypothetical protein